MLQGRQQYKHISISISILLPHMSGNVLNMNNYLRLQKPVLKATWKQLQGCNLMIQEMNEEMLN